MKSWEQWKLRWQHTFFTVGFTLTALATFALDTYSVGDALARVGLLVALAAWYAYWYGWRRDAEQAHLPFLAGAAGLWALMVVIDPTFLTVGLAILVPYCLRHPLWGAVAFAAIGAVVVAGGARRRRDLGDRAGVRRRGGGAGGRARLCGRPGPGGP